MATENTKVEIHWFKDGKPQHETVQLRSVDRFAAQKLVCGAREIAVKQPGWLQPRPYEPSHHLVVDELFRMGARSSGLLQIDAQRVREYAVATKMPMSPQVVDILDRTE